MKNAAYQFAPNAGLACFCIGHKTTFSGGDTAQSGLLPLHWPLMKNILTGQSHGGTSSIEGPFVPDDPNWCQVDKKASLPNSTCDKKYTMIVVLLLF